jgi:hypothetical protein
MSDPTIQFQHTPNPNAGKFVVGRPVTPLGTSRSYYHLEEVGDDRMAYALMSLPGVRSLFMVDDFVTVTKTAGADWAALTPEVIRILDRHL